MRKLGLIIFCGLSQPLVAQNLTCPDGNAVTQNAAWKALAFRTNLNNSLIAPNTPAPVFTNRFVWNNTNWIFTQYFPFTKSSHAVAFGKFNTVTLQQSQPNQQYDKINCTYTIIDSNTQALGSLTIEMDNQSHQSFTLTDSAAWNISPTQDCSIKNNIKSCTKQGASAVCQSVDGNNGFCSFSSSGT